MRIKHSLFFVLWLCGFVAMSAVFDDPMMSMLSLVSAVMRVIGNGFKLLIIIGGKVMKNMSNDIQKQLASGVEILLTVGNMGGINSARWLAMKHKCITPTKYFNMLHMSFSHLM